MAADPTATPTPGMGWDELLARHSEAVELAKEDLSRRLGIAVDSIAVVAIIHQEFPTDAFHCRTEKGRIYREEAPDTISGESILLYAEGRRYEYHASGPTVVFCRQLP